MNDKYNIKTSFMDLLLTPFTLIALHGDEGIQNRNKNRVTLVISSILVLCSAISLHEFVSP